MGRDPSTQAARFEQIFFGALPLLFLVALFVGYPSVQAFQLDAASDAVSKLAAMSAAPAPLTALDKQRAAGQIALVAQRLGSTENLAVVAKAYQSIGDIAAAVDVAKKVDASKPPAAVLHALTPIYESGLRQAVENAASGSGALNPAQATQLRDLAQRVEAAGTATTAETDVTLAKAYVALGDTVRASQRVDVAKNKKPGLEIDLNLAAQMGSIDAHRP